jgi:hypothetical protein
MVSTKHLLPAIETRLVLSVVNYRSMEIGIIPGTLVHPDRTVSDGKHLGNDVMATRAPLCAAAVVLSSFRLSSDWSIFRTQTAVGLY